MFEDEINQFFDEPDTPLDEWFPSHCHHKVDAISLASIEMNTHEIERLHRIVGGQSTQEFLLEDLAVKKTRDFTLAGEFGLSRSFLTWSSMKTLIQVHLNVCDSKVNSLGLYVDEATLTRGTRELSIEQMDLSRRSKNVLQREGFLRAQDLASTTHIDFVGYKNLGQDSIFEIENELFLLGVWKKLIPVNEDNNHALDISIGVNRPLKDLGLSTRTYNALSRSGYLDLNDLLMAEFNDIRDIRNFGEMSAGEVAALIDMHENYIPFKKEPDRQPKDKSEENKELLAKIKNEMMTEIEIFLLDFMDIREVILTELSLSGFKDSAASRLLGYLQDGKISIREVFENIQIEVNKTSSIKEIEPILIFAAGFQDKIAEYSTLRMKSFPTKEKINRLYAYENSFLCDEVDILEFDKASDYLISAGKGDFRSLIGQTTFFDFYDLLEGTFILSVETWDSMRRIFDFHENYGLYPNFIGMALSAFVLESEDRDAARSVLLEYLWHLQPTSADRDLSIIELRIQGNTLESIGNKHALTRERVRQILVQSSPNLAYLAEILISQTNTRTFILIQEFFDQCGAVYKDELIANLNLSIDEILEFLPAKYKKLIIDRVPEPVIFSSWTQENVLAILRKAATYYFPLRIADYDRLCEIGEIKGPSTGKIGQLFDSWGDACRQAGIESAPALRHEYVKTWSDDELISFVLRYLKDESTPGSFGGYRVWGERQVDHVPSDALIRKTFESWSRAKRLALEAIRSERGLEVRR